jgi:hypothetical protein
MKRILVSLAATCLLAAHGTAHATLSTYLGLSGLDGNSDAPGRPDVIGLDSFGFGASTLGVAKLSDSTTLELAMAKLSGTPYTTATLFFYDSEETDSQPDAELVMNAAVVTSLQQVQLCCGTRLGEWVTFSFASPSLALFLELPGIAGESSAPGHPDVIALDWISLTSDSSFHVGRHVDSTSFALESARLGGTQFPSARLLVYSDLGPQSQPDFSLVYANTLVSVIVDESTEDTLLEAVFFSVGGVIVPEPSATLLLAAALAALGVSRALRSRRAPRA